MMKNRKIVIVIFDGCQSLDVFGPIEVFVKANRHHQSAHGAIAYTIELASVSGRAVTTNAAVQIGPCKALSEIHGEIDTVLVAGGDIQQLESGQHANELHAWLRVKGISSRRLGSVCSGAFALAAAGLLDGYRATTHWALCERLAKSYPGVDVDPDALYVAQPPRYTAAGITAAIDLALALVQADLGQATALAVARELVVFLHRPGGQSQFSAGLSAQFVANTRIQKLIDWILVHPEKDLCIPTMAERMCVSERHLTRMFHKEVGMSPARFVESVRVDRAKYFLERSSISMSQVAKRSGFQSVDSLQRALKRVTGISCVAYRERFGIS
ncbi:MAG: helix-turn-helix domain-containing protein [Pseudomonadota bacterium]|nr:helix-turn-helix domain-containing protein [Pseudomonadota bacterium]